MTMPLVFMVACYAQNGGTSYERFKNNREKEKESYTETNKDQFTKEQKEEYDKFKKRYLEAFEQYKRYYIEFLEDERSVVNLMSSDDNIPIKKLDKIYEPSSVIGNSKSEIARIDKEKIAVIKLDSDTLLNELSKSKDKIEQIKDGISALETINEEFAKNDQYDSEREFIKEDDKRVEERIKNRKETEVVKKETEVAEKKTEVAKKETEVTGGIKPINYVPKGKPTSYKRISSPFGKRTHPITRRYQMHKGVDLAAPKMTPIYATADGIVVYADRMSGYGNFIKINHQSGYKSAYAHLHKIKVDKNESVKKGDIIGYVGSTGRSTGDHLHYEIYYKENLTDPVKTF